MHCRSLKSYVVCNVYRPPNASVRHCFETLGRHFVDSQLLNRDVIILGDLNCNHMSSFSPEANSLREFISMFNLSQLIEKSTRNTEKSQTLIDVIMTTNNSTFSLCDTLRCCRSDHDLVYLVLTFRTPGAKPSYITTRSSRVYS